MIDNIEQWMWGDVDNQLQIVVWVVIFFWCFLVFQVDMLIIDYFGGDFYIQCFWCFVFDYVKYVVYWQVIVDGVCLFGQCFFKEYCYFDFQIVVVCCVLMMMLMCLLVKYGGEDVVEILLIVVLFVGLLLVIEVGIVVMLLELIVFGVLLFIFQDFSGFGEIFKFGFGIVFFIDVGVIFVCQVVVGGFDGFQIVGWLYFENGIIIF